MKKLAVTIISVILISCCSALFAAGMNDTAVLTLRAYIPERTVFSADEFGFNVTSNANNFSYSVTEDGYNRTLFVVAN